MYEFIEKLLPELIVAATGAILHLSYEKISEFKERKAFEKKYPVSGCYISNYDDEENGKKTQVKAPVVLKQSGQHIHGETEFGNRAWILDGILSEDGYLHGRYYSDNKYDKGMGNFFLKIESNGNMEGLWSGYDSANKMITSGGYNFMKMLDVKIVPATKEVIPKLLSIAEKQLGDSYINENDLMPSNGATFYAAVSNVGSVGFANCYITDTQSFLSRYPKIASHRIKSLESTEKIGVLASVAVDENFKGHGIGLKLMKACLNWLKEHESRAILMTGWKSAKGVHIGGLAMRLAFEPLFEVEDYWLEDSVKNGYHCPECGAPPCHCSAVIYIKHQ